MSDKNCPESATEPGQARLNHFAERDWVDAYNKGLLLGSHLISRFGHWEFNDSHDVIINGLNRFVWSGNVKIDVQKGCAWHLHFHARMGFKDRIREVVARKTTRIEFDADGYSPTVNAGELARALSHLDTPEDSLEASELGERLQRLCSQMGLCDKNPDHLERVIRALVHCDVGTKRNSVSNKKLALATGLTVDEVILAIRRLKRAGCKYANATG